MFLRFAKRARQVVLFAQEEAAKRKDRFVSSEDLLLGLMRESDCTAVRILEQCEVPLQTLQQELVAVTEVTLKSESRDRKLSPTAKQIIDYSYDEARRLRHTEIGSEHLLLGLIREEKSLAARLLARHQIPLEKARQIAEELNTKEESVKRPAKPISSSTTLASAMYASAMEDINVGDLGVIQATQGRDAAELARTEDAFLHLLDVFLARDAQGYRELLTSAEGSATPLVILISARTPVKCLVPPRDTDPQTARFGCYVRILAGDASGQTGFLRREAFARTGPDEAPFPPPVDNAGWIS